jgi:ABC-type polysaccharide transport system permease subunit
VGIALLLNMKVVAVPVYRTIYYLPSIVPVVATSVLWMWLLNPQYGLINALLGRLGLPEPGWIADPVWSKPSLIMMATWAVGNAYGSEWGLLMAAATVVTVHRGALGCWEDVGLQSHPPTPEHRTPNTQHRHPGPQKIFTNRK